MNKGKTIGHDLHDEHDFQMSCRIQCHCMNTLVFNLVHPVNPVQYSGSLRAEHWDNESDAQGLSHMLFNSPKGDHMNSRGMAIRNMQRQFEPS